MLGASARTRQVDANTVEVPFASITGNITVNTLGGNDTLTVDWRAATSFPATAVLQRRRADEHSGRQAGHHRRRPGHRHLQLYNANDGSVVMSNFGTVTYTGLEPITNTGTATDIIFNLPTANGVTLADDGTAANTCRV